MKILCLFVRYGTAHYPDAIPLLNQWYERHGLYDQRTLWIIDNARGPQQPPEQLGPRTFLHSGDNRAWEFSAWEHALNLVREHSDQFDALHFVTSAFNTLYTEYLQHFETAMLAYVLKRNICLGHIDSYPAPVQLESLSSQSWIRTCFFFLPWRLAISTSPWVAQENRERFFIEADSREFRSNAPLSVDYQKNITSWLEGQDMGGHTWHSPVKHGLEENTRFQQKTLAILNEHHLAITFRRAGIQLVDFCWLFSERSTLAMRPPEPIPELDQLKIRRKILGIPEPA